MSYIVQHMKGPRAGGKREEMFYPTKAGLIEGLDEAVEERIGGVKLYDSLGESIDGIYRNGR